MYKSKANPHHVAVNDLSFGIARGECFGLLGVNGDDALNMVFAWLIRVGAGKSTTFQMLTGRYLVTVLQVLFNSLQGRSK